MNPAAGKPYTVASIQKNLDSIISGQYIRIFLGARSPANAGDSGLPSAPTTRPTGNSRSAFWARGFCSPIAPIYRTSKSIFGYRGQHHIERAFRDMKDPYCICFSPPRHGPTRCLRVHAFSCVLAVTLVSLLHRRVAQAGVEITQSRLTGATQRIKEITNYYPAAKRPKSFVGGRPALSAPSRASILNRNRFSGLSSWTVFWPVSIYTLPLGPGASKPATDGPFRFSCGKNQAISRKLGLEPKMNNSNSDLYYSVWYYFPSPTLPTAFQHWWNIFQWKSKSVSQGKNDPMFNLGLPIGRTNVPEPLPLPRQ